MKIQQFAQADLDLLRAMMRAFKERREGRHSDSVDAVDRDDGKSSDVYLAETPTGGLPAVADRTPGQAWCDICQSLNGAAVPMGFRELVYNYTDTEFPESKFVTVARDRWGAWLVCSAGGGGSSPADTCPWRISTEDPLGTAAETDMNSVPCADAYYATGNATISTIIPRPEWYSVVPSAFIMYNDGSDDIVLKNMQAPTASGRPIRTPGGFDLTIQKGSGALLLLSFVEPFRTNAVWIVLWPEAGGATGTATMPTSISFDGDNCAIACTSESTDVVNGRLQSLPTGCT